MSQWCHNLCNIVIIVYNIPSAYIFMGKTTSSKSKALQYSLNAKRKHRKRCITLLAATVVGAVTMFVAPSIFARPMNTSKLTGMNWVRELLTGHPIRFSDALAMPKHVYLKLVKELQLYSGLTHSKHVQLKEQVALFLHFCKTGGSVRDLWERFQHSPDTISKYVDIYISISKTLTLKIQNYSLPP